MKLYNVLMVIAIIVFALYSFVLMCRIDNLENQPPIEKTQIIEKQIIIEKVLIAEFHQTGIASWYGMPEHGGVTASGEIYDMHGLTCAHHYLSFGTELLVTNRKNGKSIRVVVNDRMPAKWKKKGRVIDLSLGSAKKLGMVADGLVRIDIKILRSWSK